MNEWPIKKTALWVVAALGIGFLILLMASQSQAADLGGNCCADLEERIAELEATTARKGNRKVSLTVYGQVNAALLYVDAGDYQNTTVNQNGVDESYVGFSGAGRINNDLTAGYTIEIDLHQLGLINLPIENTKPTVRQSYWWVKSEALGKLAVGRQAMATGDLDKISTGNTSAVAKPLSLGGLSDAYLTGLDLPWDGPYGNVVRYDSPVLAGFMLSASWGDSFDITSSDGNGDQWDVALRYAGEFSQFKVLGGVGYRSSTDLDINVLHITNVTIPTGDVKTITAVGSVKHVPSGMFLTLNYAHQDWQDTSPNFVLWGWQATAGVDAKLVSAGTTTFYGEYGQITADPDGGDNYDFPLWGAGVVQNLEGAAMDLYLGYRHYDLGDLVDEDVQTVSAGARVKF